MTFNDLDKNIKNYIFETFMRQAAYSFSHSSYAKRIEIECIYCNEKLKKGTLFLSNNNNWCYICWKANCECSGHGISAVKWLRKANPDLYKKYIEALNKECGKDSINEYESKAKAARNKSEIKEKKELEDKINEDNEATKYFKPINIAGACQKKAMEYCLNRMIPEESYKYFFYADEGKYKNRIIIPFYNKDKTITFFQGRSLDENDKVKYLSRVGKTALYNIDFVDKNKPLMVLEGPIDSMFVENSTATVGAGSSSELDHELKGYKVYWIYDNDAAGIKSSGKKVRKKENVFLWKKFLSEWNIVADIKDINDLVLYLKRKEKFKFEDFKDYFTDNKEEFMIYV